MPGNEHAARGVRRSGCAWSGLAFLIALTPFGAIAALGMAASDACAFNPCNLTRANQAVLPLLASGLLGMVGSIVGATGAWISRSRLPVALILLAAATGLIAAAGGLYFFVWQVILDGAGLVAVWFLPLTLGFLSLTLLALRQSRKLKLPLSN